MNDVQLSQVRLLKRRTRGAAAPEIDLLQIDRVYEELSGRRATAAQSTVAQATQAAEQTNPKPTIPFACVLQYTPEESEQIKRTVIDLADSFLKSETATSSSSSPGTAEGEGKHLVEFEQRKTLENLSHWRHNFMSSVLSD
jgi:hypothetical protein